MIDDLEKVLEKEMEELEKADVHLAYYRLGTLYLHPLFEDFVKGWDLIKTAQE